MMQFHRTFLAICLTCLLPFSTHAEAPVVDDSENFAILDDQQAATEQPTAQMPANKYENDEERALANDSITTNNPRENATLLEKVQSLQQEVQELRGQLEVQAHDLKMLQEQQLTFYKDLDARLPHGTTATPTNSAIKTTPTAELTSNRTTPANTIPTPIPSPTVAAVNNGAKTNPANEQISYLAAYELVKNKQYDNALNAMQTFADQYPKSGYTANAQYWLGELYLVKKNYPQAIEHFEAVLNQFPSSSKSAASSLKIGYALAAAGQIDKAKINLQQVIKNYPDTNTAQLAAAKLETLDD